MARDLFAYPWKATAESDSRHYERLTIFEHSSAQEGDVTLGFIVFRPRGDIYRSTQEVGDIVVSRTRPNPNHRHLRPWILFLPVGGTLAAFQYMSGRHE